MCARPAVMMLVLACIPTNKPCRLPTGSLSYHATVPNESTVFTLVSPRVCSTESKSGRNSAVAGPTTTMPTSRTSMSATCSSTRNSRGSMASTHRRFVRISSVELPSEAPQWYCTRAVSGGERGWRGFSTLPPLWPPSSNRHCFLQRAFSSVGG